MRIDELPEEYRPLSMWQYFLYQILFGIPLIGFIFFMSFSLRVNAVTISTDSAKSGTTDTNSKYITNTSTITINGVEPLKI